MPQGPAPATPRALALVLLACLLLAALPPALPLGPAPDAGGVDPELLPEVGRPVLREVTDAAGLGGWTHGGFLGTGNATSSTLFMEFTGPGSCWLDFDRDGWQDVYLVSGEFMTHRWKNAVLDPHGALFRNLGDGAFAEATAAGARTQGPFQGCAAADYDNDGWTDLAVLGWGGNALLRNTGGAFANVTAQAGVRDQDCGAFKCWGTSASWLDYDRDGCADLYVDHFNDYDTANPPDFNMPGPGQVNALYRNRCDGTFADVTAAANLSHEKHDSWSSMSADFDGDGWPDLYVSNDGDVNDMYLNNGDGTFRTAVNVATSDQMGHMGTAVGDADHDRDLDIVTTNCLGQYNGVFFEDGADYDDRGAEAPFDDALDWCGWATRWYDLNNDARMDLIAVNGMTEDTGIAAMPQPVLLYEGVDGLGAFRSIRTLVGPDIQASFVARGGTTADYDNDGDVDFLLNEAGEAPTHLFRSDATGGNFLEVEVVGTAPGVTRDALGAVVDVKPEGLAAQRLLRTAGDGFLGSSDPRLHAGLRYAETSDVAVTWPDGSTQAWAGLRANTFVRLTQGQASAEVLRALPLVRIDGPAEGQRLTPLAFHASADVADGAGVASIAWDLGGQAEGSGADASHAFDDVGAFAVRATVTDTLGRAATQAVRVVVRDTLSAVVEPEAARFLPVQQVKGNVTVRFSNGDPVRDARVAMAFRSSTGDPSLDALIQGLPRAVSDPLGSVRFDLEGRTGPDGRMHFDMPYTFAFPQPNVPRANHPGAYFATATGSARGSPFEPAEGTLIVVAALPPAGP